MPRPRAPLAGTDRDDVLVGTRARTSSSAAGERPHPGGGSDDLICAGPGNDRVAGRPGNDRLFGEDGNDILLRLAQLRACGLGRGAIRNRVACGRQTRI